MRGIYTEYLCARVTPQDMTTVRRLRRETGARSDAAAIRWALRVAERTLTKSNKEILHNE